MITSLMRFEARYHYRQVIFKAAALLFLALGFLITQGNFAGSGGEVYKNSPYVTTTIVCFLSLLSIFVCMLFCVNTVLRDRLHGMEELLFTTAVRKRSYFVVKLTGLLLAMGIVLCMAVAGAWLGATLATPATLRGPFHLSYYLQPMLLFGLPNVLFVSSIIFTVAMLTKSQQAVYAAALGLFVLYLTGSILGNSPMMANSAYKANESHLVGTLTDPFAITAFFGEMRSWSAAQRNEWLFPVRGAFLANRLLWIGLSLTWLLISYRYFRFRLPEKRVSRKSMIERSQPTKTERPTRLAGEQHTTVYNPVFTSPAGAAWWCKALFAQWKLETTSLFKHIPFVAMLALWIFLNAIELTENVLHGPYGIRYYTTSGIMAEELLSMRPALLLLVFFAAEMIWRERSARIDGILFATPIPNTALWSSKCLALIVMIGTLVAANILTGIGVQLVTHSPTIEWMPYLSLFYYAGFPLLLFALLIVCIQVLVPHKFLGMLVSLLVIGFILFSKQWGITSYLLRFGMVPALQYSDFNGFGHYARGFHAYMVYWLALAGALSLLAISLWPRHAQLTWWQRLRSVKAHTGKRGWLYISISLLLWGAMGWWIHSQFDAVSTARNNNTANDWFAQYEKKYKPMSSLHQPVITKVTTRVNIFPDKGIYTVAGSYLLHNVSSYSIDTLWLGVDPEVSNPQFSIASATTLSSDSLFKQYRFVLHQPLPAGDTLRIHFTETIERSRFSFFNRENSVVSNGSYIELEKYLPYLGYNNRFELTDAIDRTSQGLPVTTNMAATVDSSYHLVDYETTVSVTSDQQVVTVGQLLRTWQDGDRRFFHYKTTQPGAFMFALSAAKYEMLEAKHKDVTLRLYHLPGHTYNVPAMLQAMRDALDYGNTHFSKYPLPSLTLAEIPHYPGSATAYPGVVFSTERLNFLTDFRDSSRFNTTYATTAHEVAHQWWANALVPLDVPGRAVLTESLAKYTEAMVVEKRFGKACLSDYLKYDNAIYFGSRYADGSEQSLMAAVDQPFVYYQKGGLALYGMKELLGEANMDSALQQLLRMHAAPFRKASAIDLMNALNSRIRELDNRGKELPSAIHAKGSSGSIGTPNSIPHIPNNRSAASIQQFVQAQFKQVITYNNQLKVLHCKRLPDGRYALSLQVNVYKEDQAGKQAQALAPDDHITIAVYNNTANTRGRYTDPIYWQMHYLNKAQTTVDIVVAQPPVAVALDPLGYFLDADLSDNVAVLK